MGGDFVENEQGDASAAPYWRLTFVAAFVGASLLAVELSGLGDGAGLEFVRQRLLDHWVGGFLMFVLLFSLGNLVQVPGLMFLTAAVLALGRT